MGRTVVFLLIFISSLFSLQPGETGFSFLKIPPSVNNAILSYGAVAEGSDIASVFYNPSIPQERRAISFSVSSYIAQIKYGNLVLSLRDFRMGFFYLNSGSMAKFDRDGNYLGRFSTNHIAIFFAKKTGLSNLLNFGTTFKFVYQGIDRYNSIAVALDYGVYYLFPKVKGLALGASLRNLGYEIKPFLRERSYLPIEMLVGGSFHPSEGVLLTFGVSSSIDYPFSFSLSGKLRIIKPLEIGVGYNSKGKELSTGGSKDILNGFSFGIFLGLEDKKVGYGYTPFGELGDIHRIEVSLLLP